MLATRATVYRGSSLDSLTSETTTERGSASISPPQASSGSTADCEGSVRSAYRGVSYDRRERKWRVRISAFGVQHHVGRYLTQEAAALVYDKMAYELYGDAAITNFGVAAAANSMCHTPNMLLRLRALAAEKGLTLPLAHPDAASSSKQTAAVPAAPFSLQRPNRSCAAGASASSPPSQLHLHCPSQPLRPSGPRGAAHFARSTALAAAGHRVVPTAHTVATGALQAAPAVAALPMHTAGQGAWLVSAAPSGGTLLPERHQLAGIHLISSTAPACSALPVSSHLSGTTLSSTVAALQQQQQQQQQPCSLQQAPPPAVSLASSAAPVSAAAGQPHTVVVLDGQGDVVASWVAASGAPALAPGPYGGAAPSSVLPASMGNPSLFDCCTVEGGAGTGSVTGALAGAGMPLQAQPLPAPGAVYAWGPAQLGSHMIQGPPGLPPVSSVQPPVLAQQPGTVQPPACCLVPGAPSHQGLVMQLQGGNQQPGQLGLAGLGGAVVGAGQAPALPAAPGLMYAAPAAPPGKQWALVMV